MTAYNIIKSMTKQGNVLIAAGCFSAAIAHRTNPKEIFKIGTDVEDKWLTYYDVVISNHQDNPFVPQVSSLYVDGDSGYFVAKMERLEELDKSTTARAVAAKEVVKLCREYVLGTMTTNEFKEVITEYPTFVPHQHQSKLIAVLDLISKNTDVFECEEPDYEDSHQGTRLDMHSGNFMQRDGVLVIIDPWCDIDMDDVKDLESELQGSNY